MTIYTFGDPDLLREALLALATIFGLVEWSDPASAMGLGGNMLAAAMIGLLAVVIAGVTKQEVRVDFLLMALIIFGIAFSAKVDVNVEDIQTGDSRVVADVPIGVAMVGAAASSAAVSLTETIGTAVQRPGVTTSSLEADGFLNPLQTLYVLRDLGIAGLDEYVYKSMLEFYRMCIGNTIATDPARFNVKAFRNADDALAFMLAPANFLNFTTVYYEELNPAGAPQSCINTAVDLSNDISALTLGSDELLAKLRMLRGAKYYNQPFDLAEIDTAADIISRGTMNGQSFMAAALMRNFINDAEAWRLYDYGSNAAQYVADVTGALEEKRLSDTITGAVALEYMFPLMTFVQFLFFTLAPFIALIVIASPFTAGKTLGMYMLLGVWAYSWLPIAAIINHYMQISVGNAIEFSSISAVGIEYTSLQAIDSFYDQIANKLSIGSAALAATPIIVGALLTASMSGFQSLAGKVLGNTPTNTSMGAPKLGQGRPLVTGGGMGSLREGLRLGEGGRATVASLAQRIGYGQGASGHAIQSGIQRATEISKSAEMELGRSSSHMKSVMDNFTHTGFTLSGSTASIAKDFSKALQEATSGKVSYSDLMSLNASERKTASTHLGLNLGFLGARDAAENSAGNASALNKILAMDKSETAGLNARFSDSLSQTATGQTQKGGSLVEAYSQMDRATTQYEQEMQEAERLSQSAMSVSSITQGGSEDLVDMFQNAFSARDPMAVIQSLRGMVVAQYGAGGAKKIFDAADSIHWNNGKSIRGVDGINDRHQDMYDSGGSLMLAVGNKAAEDGDAVTLLASMYKELGRAAGTTVHHNTAGLTGAESELHAGYGVRNEVEQRTGNFEEPDNVPENTVRGKADEAIRQAGETPRISGESRAAMEAGFEGDQARVASESLPGDVAGQFAKAQTFVETAMDASAGATPGITQTMLKAWGGKAGFQTSLENFLQPALNGSMTVDEALAGLTGEVRSMAGDGGAMYDARKVYEGFMNQHGFESTDALVATYASLGMATPGGKSYMAGAIMGLAGVGANAAVTRGVSKAGLVGAGAAGLYGAVMVDNEYWSNKRESLGYLKETYTQRFAQQKNVDQGLVTAFSNDIAKAKDTQDLVDIMMAYKGNDGEPLSPEQMMAIIGPEPEDYRDPSMLM